jgi:hypothetical protein
MAITGGRIIASSGALSEPNSACIVHTTAPKVSGWTRLNEGGRCHHQQQQQDGCTGLCGTEEGGEGAIVR